MMRRAERRRLRISTYWQKRVNAAKEGSPESQAHAEWDRLRATIVALPEEDQQKAWTTTAKALAETYGWIAQGG
jgi:hypothetical protein